MVLINCSVKIVNASYYDNLCQVNYIPFSISTIKLLIQNEEYYDVAVLIKPTSFKITMIFVEDLMTKRMALKLSGEVVKKMVYKQ